MYLYIYSAWIHTIYVGIVGQARHWPRGASRSCVGPARLLSFRLFAQPAQRARFWGFGVYGLRFRHRRSTAGTGIVPGSDGLRFRDIRVLVWIPSP